MKRSRIAYFGTSRFAVPPLQALLDDAGRFEVAAVVTQPDRPAGRTGGVAASAVAVLARQKGVSLIQPEKLRRDENAIAALRALDADFFVVAAYGQILPPAVLAMPKFGCVNLHGSVLPKYRGASPIQTAILEGEARTGVTLMAMDDQMDHGGIYDVVEADIAADETFASLETKLAALAAPLLARSLPLIAAGELASEPQDHAAATFTKVIEKEDGLIRWNEENAARIARKVRAYDPWPGAHFIWKRNGGEIRIKVIAVAEIGCPAGMPTEPGSVGRLSGGRPVVMTAGGCLELVELQAEGKKPADGRAFLNGHPDLVGARLA